MAKATSIRIPDHLRRSIDGLTGKLTAKGIETTRTDFVVSAIQHYIRYLKEAQGEGEILKRLREYRGKKD